MGSSASVSGEQPQNSLIWQQYSAHRSSEQTSLTLRPYYHYQQQQQQQQQAREAPMPTASIFPVEETHMSCDTSDDETYSRLLYAAEFISQMTEGDERIRKLSVAQERYMHIKTIEELLAIRGHLQDELLRILHMLTDADPQLTSLNNFEQSHSAVVDKLRQLYKREKHIEHSNNVKNTPVAHSDDSDTKCASGATTFDGETAAACDAGLHDENWTKEELKEKHDEEERALAEQYARRLVLGDTTTGHQVTSTHDSVTSTDHSVTSTDHLLDEHLVSMQVLRGKQQRERHKLLSTERLLALRADYRQQDEAMWATGDASTTGDKGQEKVEGHWWEYTTPKSTKSHTTIKCQPLERRPISSHRSLVNQHEWQPPVPPPQLSTKQPSSPSGRGKPSDTSDEPRKRDPNERPQRAGTECTSVLRTEHAQGGVPGWGEGVIEHAHTGTTALEQSESVISSRSEEVWAERKYEDSTDDEDEEEDEMVVADNEKEELQNSLRQGLWSRLRSKLTQQDFLDMIKSYRERRQELGSNAYHGLQFVSHQMSDGDSQTYAETSSACTQSDVNDRTFIHKLHRANKDLSDGEFTLLIREHLQCHNAAQSLRENEKQRIQQRLLGRLAQQGDNKYEDDNSEKISEVLTQLSSRYEKKILQTRDALDEEQLQNIFDEYRKEQNKLRQQMYKNKQEHELKLQTRLQENSRQKQSSNSSHLCTEDQLKLTAMDNEFFHDLQWGQYSKRLSLDEFSERFAKYLQDTERITQAKKSRRKAQDDKAAASNLVEEHTQHNKHINELRRREKQITDQRLYNRLKASRDRAPVNPSGQR